MPQIIYVEHDGRTQQIEVATGTNIMQGTVDYMIEGIMA